MFAKPGHDKIHFVGGFLHSFIVAHGVNYKAFQSYISLNYFCNKPDISEGSIM